MPDRIATAYAAALRAAETDEQRNAVTELHDALQAQLALERERAGKLAATVERLREGGGTRAKLASAALEEYGEPVPPVEADAPPVETEQPVEAAPAESEGE